MASANALLPKTVKSFGLWGYNKVAAKYEKFYNKFQDVVTKVCNRQKIPSVPSAVEITTPKGSTQRYWSLESFKTTLKDNAVRAQKELIQSDLKAQNHFARDFIWRRARKRHLIALGGLFLFQEETQEIQKHANQKFQIFDRICLNIKELFPKETEKEVIPIDKGNSLSDYTLGTCQAVDASGITYDAVLTDDDFVKKENSSYTDSSWVLTGDFSNNSALGKEFSVKMMYPVSGCASPSAILHNSEWELNICGRGQYTFHNGNQPKKKQIPQHSNILSFEKLFWGDCPSMHEQNLTEHVYDNPLCLPNPPVLCAISKRYEMTLSNYVQYQVDKELVSIILLQVLEAVAHLEKYSYVHRDITPENIFLNFDKGGIPHVVLAGFGHSFGGNPKDLKVPFDIAEFDTRIGRKDSRPPEVSRAKPKRGSFVDYRKADIWNVGVLAYRLITGLNPFEDGQEGQKLDSRTYTENDLPNLLEYQVSPTVKNLAKICLSVDPAKRITAREAADVLHLDLFATSPSGEVSQIRVLDSLRPWIVAHCAEAILRKSSDSVLYNLCKSFFHNVSSNSLASSMQLWKLLKC